MLKELYEHEITTLVKVDETFIRGDTINPNNWREFLNKKRQEVLFTTCPERLTNKRHSFTVAYVDFFDQQIKDNEGDWRKVLQKYLFTGSEPLINGFVGGRTCPLNIPYDFI